ncbi:unnamed protein product [Adineta steineri]|uniref:Uncharacterized protein n=1 Tax=Adineta steineri TaxID=433720 RepID=A0A814U0E9_9BILA|nr:unnamed protein product [Adineta steineri]CAF1168712.1 unnamed protein product [Adineta steineri]CAF1411852.1 unnamed protein product [Adineta steineri]CAF1617790.1 unnamed protein product [Adineta steineri]
MKYLLFSSIFIVFLLTINLSLSIDLSQQEFVNDDLLTILAKDDIEQYHPKWRRQSKSVSSRSDKMKKDKGRSRTLTYDFLLHKWFLRKVPE